MLIFSNGFSINHTQIDVVSELLEKNNISQCLTQRFYTKSHLNFLKVCN